MKYCTQCVQPDSRPGIYFENGVCGACLWENEIKKINWPERENELKEIAEEAKLRSRGPYDCAIGVSGGKDSTFQALYARERLGLRPLLVNSEPDNITFVGARNLENIKQLGFDVISLRPNPVILRKLVRKEFFENLNIGCATERPLWASTYIIALRFGIPLVIQGDNPGQVFGINKETQNSGDALTILKHNTIEGDIVKRYCFDEITEKDLFMYHFDVNEVLNSNMKAVWLSHYAKEWSVLHNAEFSIKRGLQIRPSDIDPYEQGTYRRFFQLDADGLEVNQLLKYIKFGFGQATDHACFDVRSGHISRDEGVFLVKELDGKCGSSYIRNFCRYINISEKEFREHADTFRGPMWERADGRWILKDPVWEQTPVTGEYSVKDICRRLGI